MTHEVIHELVNDDWERLYLDGKVVSENHRISAHDWLCLLKTIGVKATTRSVEEET